MNNRRLAVFSVLLFGLVSVLFILSLTAAPASAQFPVRERFTSSLNGWVNFGGSVVWNSAGTSGSYYTPDGDLGSAVWLSAGSLASPNISTSGTGRYSLHFDWFWTGQPFTVTHGAAVGSGLNCYGNDSAPFQYFVVGVWNSCYIEFNLSNGSASTAFEATSGALDMVQEFYRIPDPVDGTPPSVPGEGDVPVTATVALPTATPLATATPEIAVPHYYLVQSTVLTDSVLYTSRVGNGECIGSKVTGYYLSSFGDDRFACELDVSPADTTSAIVVGSVYDTQTSLEKSTVDNEIVVKIGATTSVLYSNLVAHTNVVERVCQESFTGHDVPDTFWNETLCTKNIGSGWGYNTHFRIGASGHGSKPNFVTVELLAHYWVMYGVPSAPPPPPPPPLPSVLGFGTDCVFTGTVGVSGTVPITVTAPVTVSASLLVDGGFETGAGSEWQKYNFDGFSMSYSGVFSDFPYEGVHHYGAVHNDNDVTSMYLCSSVYLPPSTDVLEFGGVFGMAGAVGSGFGDAAVGFGINQGIHQAFVVDIPFEVSNWITGSNRINAGGQSSLTVCVDWPSSGNPVGKTSTVIDALSVYALNRPDGVSVDDFDNLSLICPDPELVEDENVSVLPATPTPMPSPSATPDIWGGVTPVATVGVPGGLPPIEIPVGVTPHPTTCPVYWDEHGVTYPISATIPEFGICFSPNEIDLSGVDDAVPLPFSFVSTIVLLLNAAVAFLVIGLVRNR